MCIAYCQNPPTRILVLENTHTKYPHSPFLGNTFAMTTVGDNDTWWWWWWWWWRRWWWWLIMKKLILQPNLATHRICAGLFKGQRWEIPDFTFIRYQFHLHSHFDINFTFILTSIYQFHFHFHLDITEFHFDNWTSAESLKH